MTLLWRQDLCHFGYASSGRWRLIPATYVSSDAPFDSMWRCSPALCCAVGVAWHWLVIPFLSDFVDVLRLQTSTRCSMKPSKDYCPCVVVYMCRTRTVWRWRDGKSCFSEDLQKQQPWKCNVAWSAQITACSTRSVPGVFECYNQNSVGLMDHHAAAHKQQQTEWFTTTPALKACCILTLFHLFISLLFHCKPVK